MAQLTVDAGVTLHDPVQVAEGDTRTSGWAGGLARGGMGRTADAHIARTVPLGAWAPGPVTAQSWNTGSAHHSLKFTVTADAGGASPQGWALFNVRMADNGSFFTGYRYQKADTSYNFTADYLTREDAGQHVIDSHAYTGPGTYEVRVVGGTLTVLKNGATLLTQAVADAALDSNTFVGLVAGRLTVTNVLITPLDSAGNPFAPDLTSVSVWAAIPGTRVAGSGAALMRFADNLTLSGLEPYTGYHVGVTNPIRSAAAVATGARTATGITFRNPADVTFVQPPPTLVSLGSVNNRIQRNQRNGIQAVFFKDQGARNTRTQTARQGSQAWVPVAEGPSTNVRSGVAGADLATQKLVRGGSADVRTAVAGIDLAVLLTQGAKGARTHVGVGNVDFLAITDAAGWGGRNGMGQSATIVSLPYEELWANEVPYEWDGGAIDLTPVAAVLSDTVYEAGFLVVPPGTDMSIDAYPGSEKWAFVGWDDEGLREAGTGGNFMDGSPGGPYYWGIDTAAGPRIRGYQAGASPVQNYAAGDLYTYAYGTQFDSTDPTEIKPSVLPDPPPPLTAHVSIPAGVRPSVTYGAVKRLPPANDPLRGYVEMAGLSGDLTYSTVAATLQQALGEPDLAMAPNSQGSVWFRWKPDYTGEGHLTAPGSAVEAFVGPASVAPVVGVGGYRGAYVPGTTYNPGDTVLFNDVLYTTPIATSHAPDYVALADSPAFGTMTIPAYTQGRQTIVLPHRITLPPGDYYFVNRNMTNMDYVAGATTPLGPVTAQSANRSYGYNDSWYNSTSYGSTFVLSDGGTDVAGLLGYQDSSASGFFALWEKFTLTAEVSFDRISVYSTGSYSQEDATFGLSAAQPTRPSTVQWINGISDPNPWVVATDTNPLTFPSLVPVGGGVGAATFPVRNGDIYYIRAYATAEQSDAAALHWAAGSSSLTVSLTASNLTSAPGYLTASVAGAVPGETVEFRLDNDPTVLATAVANADGVVPAFQVAVPAITEGAHLLVIHGVNSGLAGNIAFTVSATEYLPPDPDDPPTPVVIPQPDAPVLRWRLQDPTDQTYWDMPINPQKADSTLLPRNLTPAATTAIFGQPIVFEGGRRARRWTFGGSLFTMADVEILRGWLRPYRIYVSDDFGRVYIIKIVSVRTTPVRDTERPGHHTFEVQALLYGRVT